MLAMSQTLNAQQRMRYSQYLLNPFLTNPALTGVEPYWDLRAGFAQQWVGFAGAPRSIYVTGHKGLFPKMTVCPPMNVTNSLPASGRMRTSPTVSPQSNPTNSTSPSSNNHPIYRPNFHLGLGFQIFSEQSGPISYNGLAGSVAAHIKIVKELRLAVGANMEMLNYRLNTNSIQLLNANDIALSTNQASLMLPSLNAGFALYTQRFFIMGSSRQLMRSRLSVNPNNPFVSGLETHYWAQAGVQLQVAENVSLRPSIALRQINPAPPSIDLSVQGSWKSLLYLGMSYRHEDALVFMAGFCFKPQLRLDYAYDYTTSDLGRFNSGSHSIVLSFFPGLGKSFERKYFW